jgi:hypothetical protein
VNRAWVILYRHIGDYLFHLLIAPLASIRPMASLPMPNCESISYVCSPRTLLLEKYNLRFTGGADRMFGGDAENLTGGPTMRIIPHVACRIDLTVSLATICECLNVAWTSLFCKQF